MGSKSKEELAKSLAQASTSGTIPAKGPGQLLLSPSCTLTCSVNVYPASRPLLDGASQNPPKWEQTSAAVIFVSLLTFPNQPPHSSCHLWWACQLYSPTNWRQPDWLQHHCLRRFSTALPLSSHSALLPASKLHVLPVFDFAILCRGQYGSLDTTAYLQRQLRAGAESLGPHAGWRGPAACC